MNIQEKNSIQIKSVDHPDFRKYGKIVKNIDFSEMIAYMETETSVPETGNVYVASDATMESFDACKLLAKNVYADMPIEIGYCNGHNTKLNAFEYHKASEIDVAVTDAILLLAPLTEIVDNQMDTSIAEAFYLKAGQAVELYSTALHFSPCAVSDEGFKTIIVLPALTNTPLDEIPQAVEEEDKLLWMRNKWLIAHQDSIPASKGAYVGLTGENIEICY